VSGAQHTPGPWIARPLRPDVWEIVAEENDLPIADCGPTNLHAITAVPDLLEALSRIAEHTDPDSSDENYRADDREGCLDTVFALARDAIAKARGEA